MFSWPTWSRFKTYLVISMQLTLLFCVIYGLTNWWAMQAPTKFQFWMNWELQIPFVPGMILVYFSLNLLTVLPLFFLEENELKALGTSMLWATLIAGVVFAIFPAPMAEGQLPLPSGWEGLYTLLYTLDRPGNTLPSLHITYSWMVVLPIVYKWPKLRIPFVLWMLAICASVLLTKQHYTADIIAGFVLGTGTLYWKYLPRIS